MNGRKGEERNVGGLGLAAHVPGRAVEGVLERPDALGDGLDGGASVGGDAAHQHQAEGGQVAQGGKQGIVVGHVVGVVGGQHVATHARAVPKDLALVVEARAHAAA